VTPENCKNRQSEAFKKYAVLNISMIVLLYINLLCRTLHCTVYII